MTENRFCNRMILEVYFEGEDRKRINQWFEFTLVNGNITAKPVDRGHSGERPELQVGCADDREITNVTKLQRNADLSNHQLLIDIQREVSIAAPGCTRPNCINCSRRIKVPGGSRAASTAALIRNRSNTITSQNRNGSAFEISPARDDLINEWLNNQLCLTRMKLKVILAFKQIVERGQTEESSTSLKCNESKCDRDPSAGRR